MLTPKDSAAIERILKERIPLEVILKWIDEVFDQYQPKHRADSIKSFVYLESAILDRWHAQQYQAQPLINNVSEFKPKQHRQSNLDALAQYAKKKMGLNLRRLMSMNQEQAMSILTRIAAAYPRFELTTDAIGKERIKLWLDHLKDQPYEQVLKKIDQHIAEKRFPPAIAEIKIKQPEQNEFLAKQKAWEQNAKFAKRRS
ncbi:hypothetical protein BsIDN1_46060 [Bacillus safensis]|uniref:Uncharacterized protein n=2 Tax=Bacillaceae TaxID=186817 RepID=A0A5S9MDC5_BACIA|nr:hypothetical protein BsIDN1_46060 [Bacillus safensis]